MRIPDLAATELFLAHRDVVLAEQHHPSRQLIDVLGQIASAAPNASTRSAARAAAEAIHRGVVALSGSVTVA